MTIAAVVILAGTEGHAKLGRIVNGLETAREFAETDGDEIELIFDGAGTQWIPGLEDEDSDYHDLKNPLSVITSRVTLAQETGDPEQFDAIEDAADRMDEMLSELLQLTKEGELVGTRMEIELEAFARDVWADCEIDPAALEVQSLTTIRAERNRLRELFANLFKNAYAHGGSPVTVRVGTFKTEDREGFYIEDNEIGISTDEQDTVFEWGHTMTTDGTGFGLAIVAEIVEAHGWGISVSESTAGGARFEISLS